ncbi:MAG: D-alanyl-D-alanine carboxypeptidase family protein [Peptococcaceae bacterium]|nr:D-alanyl-D-alanine carboxypeptidase family protein [Peptococcaceae bacterium]
MKNRSKFVAICLSAALLTMSTMPGLAEENADPINPPEISDPSGDTPITPQQPSTTEEPEVTTTTPAYNDSHQEADGTTVISGILLVNKEHPLPADYAPDYTNGAGQSTNLQGDAEAAAEAFLAAANAQGNSMYVLSGYRSYDVQASLFANYAAAHGEEKANTFSARAGQSEHQTGLAFDVGDAAHSGYNLQTSIDQFPGVQWMMQHCAEYGFILRYPEGKEAITGYQYEPWHFRYVGVEAATAIMSSGLTLEEYLGDAQTEASAGRQTAIGRSDNSVQIDGKYSKVASYNIGGNNYFRLRDLATILAGTEAEFDVGYNDEKRLITISSKTALSGTPSLIQLDSNDVALPNAMTVMVDGLYLAPTAYNIDGFTYFKLRDIGQILDFGVDWDAEAQSMVITTDGDAILNSLMAPVTIAE